MDNKGLENVLPQTEDEVAEMELMYAALIRATHEDVVENVMLRAQIAESERQRAAAVNELCLRCGKYHMAHRGAWNGCRFYGKERDGHGKD